MSELPKDWSEIPLGDFAKVQGGSQPPKKEFAFEPNDGYVRLLQIRDFGKKPVPTYVPLDRVTKFCERDDVLIARYGASLGRIVSGMDGAYNVALAKVIADPDVIERRYLFYMLQTPIFQTPIHMISRSAQNGFNTGEIYPIRFPIAPLPEQRRIVARIEALFSRLDAGVAALRHAKAQLQRYRQSVLAAAVTGELTEEWREQHPESEPAEVLVGRILEQRREQWNGRGEYKEPPTPDNASFADVPTAWTPCTIGQIAECLDRMRVPVNKKDRAARVGEIPYYGANGQVGWINDYIFDEDLILVVEDETFTGRKIPFSYKITGKSWVNNHAHVLRTTDAVAINYLNYALMFYPFTALTTGTTGRKKLTQKAMVGAPLLLPPLAEQHQIVAEVEARTTAIDHLEAELDRQITRSNRLRQSTLKAAFTGRLT